MLSLLYAADSSPISPSLQLQTSFLNIFLHSLTLQTSFYHNISGGRTIDDICNWDPYLDEAASATAIVCFACNAFGLVESVCAEDMQIGQLHIEFVPPTTETLMLNRCSQSGIVDTRYLPREAYTIDISGNEYSGTLDLACLPSKLKTFAAADNQFSGRVVLVDLPKGLQGINLLRNRINTALVYYDNLPVSLKHVQIDHSDKGKVKPLQKQAKPVDKMIFRQFDPKQIE